MRKFVILASLMSSLLTNPVFAKNTRDGLDNYHYDKAEYVKSDIQVHVVYYKSIEELKFRAKQLGFPVPDQIRELTITHGLDGKECTIFMMDPSVKYEPEQYGHGLMHCLTGRWHEEL